MSNFVWTRYQICINRSDKLIVLLSSEFIKVYLGYKLVHFNAISADFFQLFNPLFWVESSSQWNWHLNGTDILGQNIWCNSIFWRSCSWTAAKFQDNLKCWDCLHINFMYYSFQTQKFLHTWVDASFGEILAFE